MFLDRTFGSGMLMLGVGMGMGHALLKWMYDVEKLDSIYNAIEYGLHTNARWDPCSVVFNMSKVVLGCFG